MITPKSAVTEEELAKMKTEIDALSQYDMARMWRFAPTGHPFFQPPLGKYFEDKFHEKGGFNPSISKVLTTIN
jgi:hypothetical protein